MSILSKNDIKSTLLQLECHFTWILLKEDVDLDNLKDTTGDHIEFHLTKSKVASYNMLSYVCHLKHLNEDALKNLQKAEEEVEKNHPNETDRRSLVTWGNYAWIYYYMNRYKEAQTYLSKVEDTCKKLSSTARYKIQLPEIYAEKGWALLRFGRTYYGRAKECFENALKEEPNNPECNAGRAIAMYRLQNVSWQSCKDEKSSLEPLRRAVELNPNDTSLVALLALKLQDLNLVDEGERYIEEAMKKTPDFPFFLRYAAKFYRRKGDLDKALASLKKALALTPTSSFLHHQAGLCYRRKLIQLEKAGKHAPRKQVEELIQLCIFHFKIAIEQKSIFFVAYYDLANMYAKENKYQEAEETFHKAFQLIDRHTADKQELCYHYGHFQYLYRKSESEAIKYYTEGLKIEIDSFARTNCKTALKKLLEQRIQRGSADAAAFSTLGFIHQLNSQKLQAIKCYEKALELDPENEEYLSALCKLRFSI
ncbi:interferon-induced protein with tetratricopeptide repeats 5-like [Struthio camelus]|uniref:interferon-induced protein with tetratricopeptide repeats 5-like n=1 Tax=Struthio camelus TaxID=8801 RepID=UPI003603C91E